MSVTDRSTIDDAKRRYDFGAWAGRNRLDDDLYVDQLFIPPTRLGAATLKSSRRLPIGQQAFSSIWSVVGTDGTPTLLRLDVAEQTDREAAHEVVAAVLANFESPLVAPLVVDELGDVAFTVPGDRVVVLARANITVVVANVGSAPCDVLGTAASVDDWIVAIDPAETTDDDSLDGVPTVQVRQPERARVGRIEVAVPDALQTHGPPMVKLVTGRGALYCTKSGLRVRPTGDVAKPDDISGYVYERTPTGAGRRAALRSTR